MRGKLIRVVISAALVLAAAVAVALVGGGASTTAQAADPPVRPVSIHPAGFGHFKGDLRPIPQGNLVRSEGRPEPRMPADTLPSQTRQPDTALQTQAATSTAAPSGSSFVGLDFSHWGAGWPPDPNGDVGPGYYIQTVNTSFGIFDKATGARVAGNTFDGLFSQAGTGTPCDNSNQGDPVALYDPFGDRYIVTDFAWADAQYSTGPFYQCMAVSKTSDPVNGGWYFYAWRTETGATLPDYPKLGVWPDGIYMSANLFATTGSGSFQHVQAWVFNREQMEAGNPSAQGVNFSLPQLVGGTTVFSLLPSNARAVTGAPAAGTPNYFSSIYGSYSIRTWKFHVDWTTPTSSTFTGPTESGVSTFNVGPSTVPEQGGNSLDTLTYRLMMQNQYTNIGGRESLWLTHTVGNGGSVAQVRWYELPVTGGTIGAVRQQSTWAPDLQNRFMPSLAVDKKGDMAIGYSVSDASSHPSLRYSGRLAGDALNTLSQAEQTIYQGAGFQCCKFSSGQTNTRWGDYSAMTIDPDGCTFWYTGEYYDATPTTLSGDDWQTRIGSFQLPGCSSTVPAPSISGFSPVQGPAGTQVTISGSNFTGATAVTFNGTPATFTVASDTSITATVPGGASTGVVGVTGPGGTGTSSGVFTVTTTAAPSISSISPTSGPVGTTVAINGSHLAGASQVKFGGGVSTTPVSVTDTQVTATVPSGARNGALQVTTPNGTATSSQNFRVSKR